MFIATQSYAMIEDAHKVDESSVFVPKSVGHIDLYRDNDGFLVVHNNNNHEVKKYNMDPLLRKLKDKDFQEFLKNRGYISVKKLSNDEFSLEAQERLVGGGPGGAFVGFWTGKFLTHLAFQSGIAVTTAVVGIVCPPMALPTFYALEASLAPLAEAASNTVAIGTAIIGGVATGPV